VHGEKCNAHDVVRYARAAGVDLLAVTDHQSFGYYDAISVAAEEPGRPLAVLPGIEITTHEGVHLLAIFPRAQTATERIELKGWFDFKGDGDTRQASRKTLHEIVQKVDAVGGTIVVPHPFTAGIGMLSDARKMSTKIDWLETGHIRLIQIADDKVRYVGRDESGSWVNRYVLASAKSEHVRTSSYCLAPLNRSDNYKAEEVGNECTWVRMSEPTIEGLKQVACEPRTRISRTEPAARKHDCILGLSITGGYFDGETLQFSDGLTSIIGQNYAGKSSVLDFIRFALGHETRITNAEERDRFLKRLNGILHSDGIVEAYLRVGEQLYVLRRTFRPVGEGVGPRYRLVASEGVAVDYRFDPTTEQLEPVDKLECQLEVYEQGRIGRLRDDLGRQLDMLDEFAGTEGLKADRRSVISQLGASADGLAPLYAERDKLSAQVAGLPQLEAELTEKQSLLPGDEERKWEAAQQAVDVLAAETALLRDCADSIEALDVGELPEEPSDLAALFQERTPAVIDTGGVVHADTLDPWRAALASALLELKGARTRAVAAIKALGVLSAKQYGEWKELKTAHDREISATLAKAGVESPRELIRRVRELRAQVTALKDKARPRVAELQTQIDRAETSRSALLTKLRSLNASITARRQERAVALTSELNEQIKVILRPSVDDAVYREVLQDLTAQQHVHADQLPRVTAKLSPLELAEALLQDGKITDAHGTRELRAVCAVTEHTQNVLCRIAEDIQQLNRLQTTVLEDVPEILVKRRGEQAYANLRNELSPGEQSAALLMLALQTHSLPLIIDQPEDELGYDYVVHLVVPAILGAKQSRQVLVVTHNANIAVLGDTDYVCKLENHPSGDGARHCSAKVAGAFEDGAVIRALLDLEGGQRAFQFRLHRYSLQPGTRPDTRRLADGEAASEVPTPATSLAGLAPSPPS